MIIRLDPFSKQIWNILVIFNFQFSISLWVDCHVKVCKVTVFSSGSFCQIERVTDEAWIAKTAVWPNFFLMNVFFALKASKLLFLFSSLSDETLNLSTVSVWPSLLVRHKTLTQHNKNLLGKWILQEKILQESLQN